MSNANFNNPPKGKRPVLPLGQNNRPDANEWTRESEEFTLSGVYADLAKLMNTPFRSARPRNLINKEKLMSKANQLTLEQLQALKLGDKLRSYFGQLKEVTFLGIDPDAPNCAMVRDTCHPCAPIQVIHHSNLYLPAPKPQEHVVEMFLNVTGVLTYVCVISEWRSRDGLLCELNRNATRKVIDARATEDGLLIVKYIDEPVDECAVLAAHENPAKTFN